MSMKCYIVLLIAFVLFCLSVPVIATCEGDPPGNPSCYKCENGVWVLKVGVQCGQNSDCTGECHDGCSSICFCEIDPSKCIGECKSCLPFSGVCYDDPAECPGECDWCADGECEDVDGYCDECETCLNGSCNSDCSPTQTCCNDSCCDSGNCCNGTTCCNNSNDVCCTDSGSYCCESGKTCCQGDCCEPDEHCENGVCECDDCWTTTTEGWIQECPACDISANDFCPGKYKKRNDYSRCWPASTGVSGRCECYETEQVIGYDSECKPVISYIHICGCPTLATMCLVLCVFTACDGMPGDEVACYICVLALLMECIDPCSYIKKCDEDDDTRVEKTALKFSSFGGGTCTG